MLYFNNKCIYNTFIINSMIISIFNIIVMVGLSFILTNEYKYNRLRFSNRKKKTNVSSAKVLN